MKKLLIITLCIFLLSGCGETKNTDSSDGSVNYMEAKEKIINDGAILLDVRTKEEYNEKHIDGASLLPLDKIDIDSISSITDLLFEIDEILDNDPDADDLEAIEIEISDFNYYANTNK